LLEDARYYLSGPPAMLQTLSQELRARGISADAIRIDAWE
jgi:NAD(P)H-flavin reductase